MANEKILLKAKANQLGIEGYRTMSVDELHTAIANAEGKHTAPAKGKTKVMEGKKTTSTNGSKGKTKGKSAVAKATKGKTTTAPAKGKSTSQKSSAKPKAAKGKVSRAASPKGKGKSTTAKGTAKRTPAKAKSSAAKSTSRSRKSAPARADIDRSKIDWKAESNVGRTGKRAEVMDALRKHKGNYDKTFETLQDRARSFYKGKSKHDAERMLRWLINRVAFDFVMSTEQHTPGERAGYGQSDKPQDVRRRERREEARKTTARKR
jgi:hypothetical protein